MQRDTIVYFGIIQYEYNNAMCQHVKGIEKLIENSGYKALAIGVSPNVKRKTFKQYNKKSYMINEPQNTLERIIECLSAKDIKRIIMEIGIDRIHTFIMADFRYLPMKQMRRYCEKNGIQFAVNIMDCFMSEKNIFSIIKKIDCDIRMKFFYPKIDRRIYICSAYNSLIGKGKYTSVIPGVTWCREVDRKENKQGERIQLVFLGRPGLNCEKEKIDWIIRAIAENGLSERFRLLLAGFDEKEFIRNNKQLTVWLSESIVFCGRISHDQCIELLMESDFSLVIRPNTVLSQYGFSTKIGEAFSCGTPVLATDTSDNRIYIENGKNGFVCEASYDAVSTMIKQVAKLNNADISAMKRNIIRNNPLDYKRYIHSFMKVIGV